MPRFDVEVTARRGPLELLIVAGAAAPLDHLGAVSGGCAIHIQAHTAVAADDVEIATAFIYKLPVLPGLPVGGVLTNLRADRKSVV